MSIIDRLFKKPTIEDRLMKPSNKCLAIIREFEGFSPKPYKCPAGVPTIGYGSTRYENGTPVKLTDSVISISRADNILTATLEGEYAPAVRRYVQREINQDQFDALVSFAYNLGTQALRKSALLAKVNRGDFDGAADEFAKWIYANGQQLPGLVRRRKAEADLFRGLS